MQLSQAEPTITGTPPAGSLTIEAGTAESALEEVTNRLGPDAEIIDARKVQKGGIGGFFARELVQITARPRTDRPSDFETMLTSALRDAEPEPEPVPVGVRFERSEEAATPASPPSAHSADWRLTGGAGWSVTALARCDLPSIVTQAVMDLDPRDDLGWVAAVAGAVAPLCRPLPSGAGVLAGPGAGRMGRALGLPVVDPDDVAPYGGEFAADVSASDSDGEWLQSVRGDRWLHLVVGEGDSTALLDDNVLAVSWSGDQGVATALRLASSLGLVLGYGMGTELGASAYRATPVDVALAVRKLVGRR